MIDNKPRVSGNGDRYSNDGATFFVGSLQSLYEQVFVLAENSNRDELLLWANRIQEEASLGFGYHIFDGKRIMIDQESIDKARVIFMALRDWLDTTYPLPSTWRELPLSVKDPFNKLRLVESHVVRQQELGDLVANHS